MPRKIVLVLLVLLLSPLARAIVDSAHVPEWSNISVQGRKMTVFSLFTDSRGLVWVGTNGGLFSYDGFELSAPAPASEYKLQIYSLVEHDGKLYAGDRKSVV